MAFSTNRTLLNEAMTPDNQAEAAYLLFQDPADSIPNIPGYETDINSKKFFNFQWFENRYESV